jgi:two-component system, response regulator RegA
MIGVLCPMPVPYCPYLYLAAILLSGINYFFGNTMAATSGSNSPALVLTITAAISLIAAIGTQIDAYRKRTMQFRMMESELGKVKEVQEVHRKAIGVNRQNQEKIQRSLKGLEELRNVGLLQSASAPSGSILIVDDDPTWVNQLGRFFVKNLGSFNLLQALDLPSALKEVERAPSWIFLDIKLGDRSGLEIVAPAKSYNPQARIVVVTGWNDPDELQGAVTLGVEIWRKPISPDDLHRIVVELQRDFGSPAPSSDAIPVAMSPSMTGVQFREGPSPSSLPSP